ncbi:MULTISPECIES: DUF3332 family protein [Aliivibrio]|uniref:DUF3332 family protein n=1 Tax=Aliivibrio TaxID=511678 RepID=UPI00080E3697|nr:MULTISPECIES: DUF3332 family protein [Aliivibrio]MBD1568384.1 DUF3332 family protein [Aliivibrio sp. S10_S31]OCH33681.1 hypothetical protein A6E13_01425 [Aliivibrio fischeri]
MTKSLIKIIAISTVVMSLSGCVGSNALTGMLMKFNVQVVDNRYARAGVNFLLSPVYALTLAGDYIVFNSLEFWTGKNVLSGSPHIFDSKVDTMMNINDDLDDSLKTAPIDPISSNRVIESGEMKAIDENTIQMDITYNNGDKAILMGVRDGDNITYYMDGYVVSQTSIQALEELAASQS